MTTIVGTKNNDTINDVSVPSATITSDMIDGREGNDVINALAGLDKVLGGTGDDFLIGGADADLINGGGGSDTASYETSLSGVVVKLADGAGTQLQSGTFSFGPVGYQITVTLGGGDAAGDKLTGIEHLIGSKFDDTLLGNSGANWMHGGAGNDIVQGGAGNDEIYGGAGNDILNGGFGKGAPDLKAGIDSVSYEDSPDAVTIDFALLGVGTQKGGDAEGDFLSNFRNVWGSGFGDFLTGDGNDNWFEGGAGADTIDGKGGSNTALYWEAKSGVDVDLNLATQVGTSDESGDVLTNIQNLEGSNCDDVLIGLTGQIIYRYINALDGNDFVVMNKMYQLDGGLGRDWVDFSPLVTGLGEGVFFKLAAPGVYTKVFQEDLASKHNILLGGMVNFEHFKLTDGNNNVTGNAVDNIFQPIAGKSFNVIDGGANAPLGGFADLINAPLGGFSGVTPTAFEGPGDTLDLSFYGAGGVSVDMGKTSSVFSFGLRSSVFDNTSKLDRFVYFKNFENIYGTTNKDDITGNAFGNILQGADGNDILNGGAGNDWIFGGAIRMPTGVDGVDTLKGDAGDDFVNGGAGGDAMDGGAGNDTLGYRGSPFFVQVQLKFGFAADVAGSDAGSDAIGDNAINFENLYGSKWNDILKGDIKANVLWGGRGNDQLFGGDGNDAINGDSGDDEIYGGNGADKMDGGKGIDTLEFDVVVAPNITVDLSKNKISATNDTKNEIKGDTIVNFENVEGGNGNDVLTGSTVVNVLEGMIGDDTVQGLGGADTLDGGDGTDTVSYALSAAGVAVDLTQQGAYIGSERDTAGPAQKGGDAEGDLLWGFENIVGSAKNDSLFGDEGVNKIDGGAGDDVIEGRGSADDLIGGLGNDTLSYAGEANAVKVTLKAGLAADLSGNAGTDAENDKALGFENLLGGSGNDILTGDAKDNVIEGGAGDDKMTGGGGKDTLSYAHSANDVEVVLDKGEILLAKGDATGDTATGFTNMLGGSGNDALTFQGDSVAHKADGGAGEDNLVGAQGMDTLSGGDDNDGLVGNAGADTLNGGAGDDDIVGGAGADVMDGGDGDETEGDLLDYVAISGVAITVTLGAKNVQTTVTSSKMSDASGDRIKNFENITGGDGNDVLTGNAGVNEILGNDGDDTIAGGGGADKLNGGNSLLTGDTVSYKASATGVSANLGSGEDSFGASLDEFENIIGSGKNDELTGGDDANKIDGGMGDDLIEGGLSGDFLIGGVGNDTLSYEHSDGGVSVTLVSGKDAQTGLFHAAGDKATGFENLIGSAHVDELTGDTGANKIDGGAGGDDITGGGGNDTLQGGLDGDELTGGSGNDFFRYTDPTEGDDDIVDFNNKGGANGADKIQIVKDGFGIPASVTLTGTGADNFAAEYFVSGANPATAATKAHGQFIFDTDDFQLLWDDDGTGGNAAVLIADFGNSAVITAADFDLK